ncbi:MAG: hypothetical protein RDV41_13495 [Planctomycetota bacterium]|nr:hypothetical protein [Planctomycetota bacterium]
MRSRIRTLAPALAGFLAVVFMSTGLGAQEESEALARTDKVLEGITALDESACCEIHYGLLVNGFHVGWGSVLVEKGSFEGKDAYRLTAAFHVSFGDDMVMDKSQEYFMAPNMVLLQGKSKEVSRQTKDGAPEEKSREIALKAGVYSATITEKGATKQSELTEKGPVVGLIPAVLRRVPLTEGAEYAFRVVDDDVSGMISRETVLVGKRGPHTVAGREQELFEISWKHEDGKETRGLADDKGLLVEFVRIDPPPGLTATQMSKDDAQKTEQLVFKPTTPEEAMKEGPKSALAMMFSLMPKKDTALVGVFFDMEPFCENVLARRGTKVDKTDQAKWLKTVDFFASSMLKSMVAKADSMPGPAAFMLILTEKIDGDKAEVASPNGKIFVFQKTGDVWKIVDLIDVSAGKPKPKPPVEKKPEAPEEKKDTPPADDSPGEEGKTK